MQSKILRIGKGMINEVGNALAEEAISGKILYVSDPVIDALYGGTVRKQISEIGTVRVEYISANTISYAMTFAERIIATDIQCIVGMGGGKVLDVCKYASYISKTPFLSLPTTAANDGLSSPIAVLKRQDNKPKSLQCSVASMVLIDTNIIINGPQDLIKAGIGDTISNYTALMDWDLAYERKKESMNGYAHLMSNNALDILLKAHYNAICPEFVELLVNSLVLSGIAMDFAGSSRPVSGSEHLFSHALDYYSSSQNLHGLQTALGTVSVLRLMEKDTNEIVDYLHKFEVNVNPKHLNIDEDSFVLCFQNATKMRENRYTYLNEIDLNTQKLKSVYKWLVRNL